MEKDSKEFFKIILNELSNTSYIKCEDIPNIDLYMDQVTTFMDEHLESCKRHEDDKILTKTMINNYAKNNVLPAPEKKKYSREHMLTLLLIYYFKSFLSINDIQTLMTPILDNYFGEKEAADMTDIYKELLNLCHDKFPSLTKDIQAKFEAAQHTFEEEPADQQDLLHLFSFICLLSFDVYEKKRLIEFLIDSYFSKNKNEKNKGDKK